MTTITQGSLPGARDLICLTQAHEALPIFVRNTQKSGDLSAGTRGRLTLGSQSTTPTAIASEKKVTQPSRAPPRHTRMLRHSLWKCPPGASVSLENMSDFTQQPRTVTIGKVYRRRDR